MTFKLTLHGEPPSKKNSRINTRSGRSFPSKKFSQWHAGAVSEIRRQWEGAPLAGTLNIALVFLHKDKKRRDSDNQVSSILDTLVDAGVLQDDSWRIVRWISVTNITDPERKGRCEITIMEGQDAC